MSDEEFDELIKNLKRPLKTSEGGKHPINTTHNNNPMPSLRANYMYGNTPLPKIQHNNYTLNHMFDGITGRKQSIDTLLEKNPLIWKTALSNELGRLSQGIRDIEGNDVIDFIKYDEVPKNRIVTYANMVCDIRPLKTEKFRVRLTVGGDRLQYPDDTASPAATLLETKLLLNSTISQSANGVRFMTMDIKDFFLQTIMPRDWLTIA